MITTLFLAATISQSVPLKAGLVVKVDGPSGGYDYCVPDPDMDRIYGAHSKVGGLTVLDLKTNSAKDYPGPKCNGIWVDAKDGVILSDGADKKLVQWDRDSMTIKKTVDLEGPGDAAAFDSKRNEAYIDEDDGKQVFVFDPVTLDLKAKVEVKEAPEWIQYDAGADKIFQNIKSEPVLQVIDPETHKVVNEFALTGLTSVHGMGIDSGAKKIFSVGGNGKVVQVNMETGAIEATIDIDAKTDQAAYDPDLKRLYAVGGGFIAVVQFDGTTIKSLGKVKAPKTSHTLAIDPKTHAVWVPSFDAKGSSMNQFLPTQN